MNCVSCLHVIAVRIEQCAAELARDDISRHESLKLYEKLGDYMSTMDVQTLALKMYHAMVGSSLAWARLRNASFMSHFYAITTPRPRNCFYCPFPETKIALFRLFTVE